MPLAADDAVRADGVRPVDGPIDAVRAHAATTPGAAALLDTAGHALAYGDLRDLLDATRARLEQLGIAPGDRVVVAAGAGLGTAVLLLALLDLACCCPVDPTVRRDELRAVLDLVRPAAVVVPANAGADLRHAAASRGLGVIEAHADPAPVLTPVAERRTPRAGTDDDAKLLLRTSGTTARGKIVALTAGNIVAGARATGRAYALTPDDRRLNLMPLFHVQGLVGSLLASLAAGSSVVCAAAFDPAKVAGWLRELRPTWFSASPAMHRLILDAPGRPDGHALRFVRSGSAALPAALRADLADAYAVPVVESYGMSEAHQIASTPLPPQPPARGMVATGSEIGIRDDHGTIHRTPGATGEIVVRGPNVVGGYLWPSRADEAFTGGWFRTGDLGALHDDGSLAVTGRLKELIDRGGEKVSPREIEDALARHPDVERAAVFGVPDPVLTERIAAAVVLRAGAAPDADGLRRFTGRRIAPHKVPELITFRDALPVSATGKIQKHELARELEPVRETAGNDGPRPRTATEAALAGLWAFALDVAHVSVEDDFFARGGDSLAAVALLSTVEEVFGVVLGPQSLFDELNTVARMAAHIAARTGEAHDG